MRCHVLFEGPDGVGKTTFIQQIAKQFEGRKVLITKEPGGGTGFRKQIREILLSKKGQELEPLTQRFLFYADRVEHVEKILKKTGAEIILQDRGFVSTMVYQTEHIPLNNEAKLMYHMQEILNEHSVILGSCPPSMIAFCRASEETIRKRLAGKEDGNAKDNPFAIKQRIERYRLAQKLVALFMPTVNVGAIDELGPLDLEHIVSQIKLIANRDYPANAFEEKIQYAD